MYSPVARRTRAPALLIPAVVAASIGMGSCGQEPAPPRYTRAVAPPMRHLESVYPAVVRAEHVVLPGALIARGDSLFHGVVPPGNCTICHGVFLTAGTGGMNLRDGEWHNGDGSYDFLVETITDGVTRPDHLTMPPRGGMELTDADVRALAAYVYWKARTPAPAPAGAEMRAAPDSAQPGGG